MDVRQFRVEDHKEIAEWWRKRKWDVIPLEALPVTGVVVFEDGKNICAGWLYTTGTAFGWLEWIVTNPEAGLKQRAEAVRKVIETLKGMALAHGVKIIFNSSKSRGLIKSMEKTGFYKTDTEMTNMVWRGQ